MFISPSLVPQTGIPAFWRSGVRHSTFEPLRLGRSIQSIASGFLRFWDSLNFKKDKEFVGITIFFLDEKIPWFMGLLPSDVLIIICHL
uniref:Uncharacterized protein n=1 Tax=Brassica oleracea var. oleracea TaxID=109376 RepID=A0A0D3AV96_BRAOL